MRFFIILATLCLAAAYPSTGGFGFVDVDVPMTMEPTDSDEVEANPEVKMPEVSDATKEDHPEVEEGSEGQDENSSEGTGDQNENNSEGTEKQDKDSSEGTENQDEGNSKDTENQDENNSEDTQNPTSSLCSKVGNIRDPESCGFIMCAPNADGSFNKYHISCDPRTCFDEETNSCQWK